jgi:UPF0042 nucleotide-binding protein
MTAANTLSAQELVLITGMSGSGKSVALRALEDAGYYCVDNLPPELLDSFLTLEGQRNMRKIAIAMDVRSAQSLHLVPQRLRQLRTQGLPITCIFLDASTDMLVRRFSETRRLHPLSRPGESDQHRVLEQAINLERELLNELREHAHAIDTSMIRPSQLQLYIKDLVGAAAGQLTLVFESFAFKRGVPLDADYVFDVRMLSNPHYEKDLRPLTGRDEAVAAYLQQSSEVAEMFQSIEQFLLRWLEPIARDHRSYVTVAVGCTGGQHRSVYLVESLEKTFSTRWNTLKRHRELDAERR